MNQPRTMINAKPAKAKIENSEAEVVNALDNLKVEIVDAPSLEQLDSYLPEYVMAIWEDKPGELAPLDPKQRRWITNEVLHGRTFLPTAAETIGITFKITGLSVQDITHLIRYRRGSFSAQCTGDRFMTDDIFTIPAVIEESKFASRYNALMSDIHNLYIDMVNEGISPLDARYVMPMARSSFYYARFSYSDAISIIRQRIDRNIQPMSDNVLAYKMYEALLEKYPNIWDHVDIDAPPKFYLGSMETKFCSNLYLPEDMHMPDRSKVDQTNYIYGYREWPESFKKHYEHCKAAQQRAKAAATDTLEPDLPERQ